jgi:hypothetical protein
MMSQEFDCRGLGRPLTSTGDYSVAGSGSMILRGVRAAVAAAIVLVSMQPAAAAEWWMLQNTDDGRQCGPPLEADGVVLTPDAILKRFEECKLSEETPTLDLNTVMVACEGSLNQVFVFTKTKESCEELAKD